MSKLFKSIINFAALGDLIGLVISVAFSYAYAASNYYPSSPAFVGSFNHQLDAVAVSALLWAIIGELFGFGSFIFVVERWSLRRRTIINFCTYYLGLSILAILAGWFPLNGLNFLIFTAIFIVIYIVIWFFNHHQARKEVQAINQKIKQK